MRKLFSKFALVATLGLAITFTFSCSGGDDDGGSSGGQGTPFNENSQVYKNGTAYEGSGIIKIRVRDEDSKIIDYINAGNVTDGIVDLKLPQTISDKYLLESFDGVQGCTGDLDIKSFDAEFRLDSNDGDYIGNLDIGDDDNEIMYSYFSKAGKITCKLDDGKMLININAKKGWNSIYRHYGKNNVETSTNNILTKEVTWYLR